MREWINVRDRLPKSGERVLVSFWEESIESYWVTELTYWEENDIMGQLLDSTIQDKKSRFMDYLMGGIEERAEESGFYQYLGSHDCTFYRCKVNITHWMPLPEPEPCIINL